MQGKSTDKKKSDGLKKVSQLVMRQVIKDKTTTYKEVSFKLI